MAAGLVPAASTEIFMSGSVVPESEYFGSRNRPRPVPQQIAAQSHRVMQGFARRRATDPVNDRIVVRRNENGAMYPERHETGAIEARALVSPT